MSTRKERKKARYLEWAFFLNKNICVLYFLLTLMFTPNARSQPFPPGPKPWSIISFGRLPCFHLPSQTQTQKKLKKLKNLLGACISPIYVYRGVVAASAVVRRSTQIQNLPPKNARNKTTRDSPSAIRTEGQPPTFHTNLLKL